MEDDNLLKDIKYRSEESSGSGVRDIIDIMTFEIYELGNNDILYYVCEHYLTKETKDIIVRFIYALDNGTEDISEDEIRDICIGIIDEINKQTGHNLKYGLWLADYDVVTDMYAYDPSTIEAYKISNIILSDLGRDGQLYAYDEMPEPIEE